MNFVKTVVVSALAFSVLCLTGVSAAAQNDLEVSEYKTLDKTNLIIKEWLTDVSTDTKMLDHVTTYNSDGKKVEEEEYNNRGLLWRKLYEYGPNGKVSRELTYDFHGRLDNVKKYEYNEFNRRATESTFTARGKLVKIKVYEYIVSK